MLPEKAPPVPVWRRPWSLALYGLGTAVVAVVLASINAPIMDPYRVGLIAASLILPGVAIIQRLRRGVTDLEDRTEPACLVGLAALVAFLASLGCDSQAFGDKISIQPEAATASAFNDMPKEDGTWDSGIMLCRVLGGVALLGACLVALPSIPRKMLVSLIILFHFGGILTAVTSVPPPGGTAPWLSIQAWGYIYHPYLQFMYLNNAYHFYSPEPGPPTLLWFRVKYQSGESAWVKLPSRSKSPIPMQYMRLVAMSETFNDVNAVSPEEFTRRLNLRDAARINNPIPLHPGYPVNNQYAKLSEYSERLLSSYVRHVANTSPNPRNPADPVVSVKAYRVTHRILTPEEYSRGVLPIDLTTYLPVYCGDFDAEGRLLDPNDPMLYWLMPIYKEGNGPRQSEVIRNYFKVHAGDATVP